MSLFSTKGLAIKSDLAPDWVVLLPRRLTAGSPAPRSFLCGRLVLAWGPKHVLAVEAASGALAYRKRLGAWRGLGFDVEGRLVLGKGETSRRGFLDVVTGEVRETPLAQAAPEQTAHDTAEHPEADPTLSVGDRLYRVRSETRSRVTRHWVEISDRGGVPRSVEVASFTLRSDRLTLTCRGGGLVYGAVGMDPDHPAGALVGGGAGPVLFLRRRFSGWHEHSIPVEEPDLVGHGPARLDAVVVPEGDGAARERPLGRTPETWSGLETRGGAHPPFLSRGLGARPVGIASGKIIVELVELAAGWPPSAPATPRRRFLAGFSAADICCAGAATNSGAAFRGPRVRSIL